ncbi:MAG: hypothetical protein DRI61_11010 [Chloroflexi bacterium]|nr:MAG: hypothetical protein DRI61_11010 [Chloroflexota bacterium]
MGLGNLIEETFKKIVDYIIELADDFADVLKRGMRMFISSLLQEDLDLLEEYFDKTMGQHPEFKKIWEEEKRRIREGKTSYAGFLIPLLGYVVSFGGGMLMGGFGRDIQNFFNSIHPVTPFSPDILAYGKHTGKIDDNVFKTDLKSQGFAEEKHSVLYDYYKPKLPPTALLEAEKRIEKLDYDVTQALKDAGFNDKEINILRELSYAYPSPTDFIRFAVRDVFTKDTKTQEALSAEFPEDIVPYAEKAGMRRDVLMWYWKAHWELPSPTQVYEMLHRLNPDVLRVRGEAYREMGLELDKLETTKETVEFYLKQADYDRRWRQRLLAISYNPLTRVDLRRIYELGLVDDNELLARLMEVGYTKKDAQLLVEFYKTFRQEEARTFAKTEIKYLLYYGIINEAEAKVMLERLGYTEEDAKTMIELWKVKLAEKDMRETQKFVRDAYALGEITRTEAERILREVGLSEEVIGVVLDKEDKRRLKSQKLPSPTTVVKWLKTGVITKEKAREILRSINVKEEYIEYYIKEAEVEGGE